MNYCNLYGIQIPDDPNFCDKCGKCDKSNAVYRELNPNGFSNKSVAVTTEIEQPAKGKRTVLEYMGIVIILLLIWNVFNPLLNRPKEINIYGANLPKLVNDFSATEKNGIYKDVYFGVKTQGNKLTIFVTDDWDGLSNDIKLDFLQSAAHDWVNKAETMGIVLDSNKFGIDVNNKTSGQVVASYDSIGGFRLKE